jgi:hypothetical protein
MDGAAILLSESGPTDSGQVHQQDSVSVALVCVATHMLTMVVDCKPAMVEITSDGDHPDAPCLRFHYYIHDM